jgi:type IV pilus assembly protein PilB
MGKRLKLGEMLVAKGLISDTQLAAALGEQRRWGKRLGMTLVLMGYLEEEVLIRTLAAQLKLPVARIRGKRVNAEVIELVPVELAEKHRCLPLFMKDQGGSRELFLAMEDPSDLDAQGELGFRIGFRIRPVLVAPTELEDALQRHYHWAAVAGAASPPLAPLPARVKDAAPMPLPEKPEEPFEDTEPELHAAAAAAAAAADGASAPEEPGDTQPDPPDIERAAAELGGFDEPGSAPSPRRAPAARAEPAPNTASPAMSPDVILRALSQLLVEKGVLSREELVERLRVLAAKEASDGTRS